MCYSYKIVGEAALLFLRAVHFKILGCIPETRLGYLENKVREAQRENDCVGGEIRRSSAEEENITHLSSSNCIRKAEEAVFIQKLRMNLVRKS